MVAVLALSALLLGSYFGTHQVAARFLGQSVQDVSYQTPDRLHVMLERANHSVATKSGSFLDEAPLTGPGTIIGIKAVS